MSYAALGALLILCYAQEDSSITGTDNFLLLDGSDFLLLDNSNFLLLEMP